LFLNSFLIRRRRSPRRTMDHMHFRCVVPCMAPFSLPSKLGRVGKGGRGPLCRAPGSGGTKPARHHQFGLKPGADFDRIESLVGWAKARSCAPCPPRRALWWARFALPTLRHFPSAGTRSSPNRRRTKSADEKNFVEPAAARRIRLQCHPSAECYPHHNNCPHRSK
jgi:hypothetical protein